MTTRITKYWIAAAILPFLTSCEKEVKNNTIPDFEQKLVVTSFITPSKLNSILYVSSNSRIYGELGIIETLGDLNGYISNDIKEVPLVRTNTGFMFNPANMTFEEGKTYNLRITSSKGMETKASCTVPLTRKLQISIDTFTVFKTGWWPNFRASVSIIDFPGEVNYYRLFCKQVIYNRLTKVNKSMRLFTDFKNEFFTDAGKDGMKIDIASLGISNYTNTSSPDSSVFIAYVFNTTKAYYDYHLSIKNYSGGDDPFTEVSPVFTNITGGLGIFAAYTTDSAVMIIK